MYRYVFVEYTHKEFQKRMECCAKSCRKRMGKGRFEDGFCNKIRIRSIYERRLRMIYSKVKFSQRACEYVGDCSSWWSM